MDVDKSDESKMSLIFHTACFIGITSAFLIGYMLGILGYANQFYPYIYNRSVTSSGVLVSVVLAAVYICGILAIQIRKHAPNLSRLDMRRHMILGGALLTVGSVVTALISNGFMFVVGPIIYTLGFGLMYQA
ncbi:hypothetical protein C5167_045236 [Papaver somniferum]|uniref:Uncharacterized protein n=1 Tax=Papaver somniferum TaxID=3469 RepID=A0A4Y7LAA4_PAPSO|nr:hypothetical protein C5167_045236 [Papaver somniferum]